jgi:hypothetical protein
VGSRGKGSTQSAHIQDVRNSLQIPVQILKWRYLYEEAHSCAKDSETTKPKDTK